MHQAPTIVILQQVDSTNNYAMGLINAQMATNGSACFAYDQTAGRGQRGKSWSGQAGQSIALSVIFDMKSNSRCSAFCFQAAMALAVRRFLQQYIKDDLTIKWPNDLYWNDRKAAGILIENKFSGTEWNWAVVGVGININQELFNPDLPNPVSLFQITGVKADPLQLAKELHLFLLDMYENLHTVPEQQIIEDYNEVLYKRHQYVRLKTNETVIETRINRVTSNGQLLTQDQVERSFQFGEVEWLVAD